MKIDYNGLISLSLTEHTKQVLGSDSTEKLTFFIENSTGWEYLDSYSYVDNNYRVIKNHIRIFKAGHNNYEISFIRDTFNQLDDIIDLDFEELSHNNGSQIDIYSVNSSSNMPNNALGQALIQRSSIGSWWDIFWRDTNGVEKELNKNDKNTLVHEIGHVLGLSHPFEDPYNEQWNSDDTVMSYNIGSEGWNTWYSDEDIDALLSIWGREDDNSELKFRENHNTYKFRKSEDKEYYIKSEIGLENITNINNLFFNNTTLNVEDDIKSVFRQIESIDDITGQIYRLYNAAFGRFPDTDGLKYWIAKNQSGENSFIQIARSFINSEEFHNQYGNQNSNEEYISNLYKNILEREPDQDGFNYWLGQINNGVEERAHLLMGFSESTENKEIFKLECGF